MNIDPSLNPLAMNLVSLSLGQIVNVINIDPSFTAVINSPIPNGAILG